MKKKTKKEGFDFKEYFHKYYLPIITIIIDGVITGAFTIITIAIQNKDNQKYKLEFKEYTTQTARLEEIHENLMTIYNDLVLAWSPYQSKQKEFNIQDNYLFEYFSKPKTQRLLSRTNSLIAIYLPKKTIKHYRHTFYYFQNYILNKEKASNYHKRLIKLMLEQNQLTTDDHYFNHKGNFTQHTVAKDLFNFYVIRCGKITNWIEAKLCTHNINKQDNQVLPDKN